TEVFRLGLIALWAYRTTKRFHEGDGEADQIFPSPAEALRLLVQDGLGDIVKTVPIDLLVWQRFRGTWDAELVASIEAGCIAAWGDAAAVADVISAATSGVTSGTPSTTVALAASLAAMADLRGNPRLRFQRDLLLVFHTALSLARRRL